MNVYYVRDGGIVSRVADFDELVELNSSQKIWSADVASRNKKIAISDRSLL